MFLLLPAACGDPRARRVCAVLGESSLRGLLGYLPIAGVLVFRLVPLAGVCAIFHVLFGRVSGEPKSDSWMCIHSQLACSCSGHSRVTSHSSAMSAGAQLVAEALQAVVSLAQHRQRGACHLRKKGRGAHAQCPMESGPMWRAGRGGACLAVRVGRVVWGGTQRQSVQRRSVGSLTIRK